MFGMIRFPNAQAINWKTWCQSSVTFAINHKIMKEILTQSLIHRFQAKRGLQGRLYHHGD
jgi:hypothetical protein